MAQVGNITTAYAPVQHWNAQTVYVRCPFCTKIHTHGFGGSYNSIVRAAHCDNSAHLSFPSYSFAYPFSFQDGTTAYEIDKSAGFFVALGSETLVTETGFIEGALDELNLNADRFADRRSWEDAIETVTIGTEDEILRRLQEAFGGDDTFTMKRMDHVLSQMLIFGDYQCVEDYIRTNSEVEIFLHGIDEEGNSALNLAACEKYPAIVKLLLEHGADVDSQNKNGRSPLMEAALWGRIDNVKYLLEHGANKTLRDVHGRRAADLAEQSPQNDEERYLRSGREHQVYREVTFMANQARRVILELLKDQQDQKSRVVSVQDQAFQAHSFRKSNRGTIQLVAPIAEFPVPNEWKTIASLQRPPNYPSIAAMGGWSHGKTKITVSGREWTDEVIGISQIVGHQLQNGDHRDQGVRGQYFASHAEKQLIAYFISKHVLIRSKEPELLRLAEPPVFLKQATILVSRPPCDDCSKFINAVNATLRLMISVLDRSEG